MAGQRQLGQCHCPQRAGAPFDLCPFADFCVVDGVPDGRMEPSQGKFSKGIWSWPSWPPLCIPVSTVGPVGSV